MTSRDEKAASWLDLEVKTIKMELLDKSPSEALLRSSLARTGSCVSHHDTNLRQGAETACV